MTSTYSCSICNLKCINACLAQLEKFQTSLNYTIQLVQARVCAKEPLFNSRLVLIVQIRLFLQKGKHHMTRNSLKSMSHLANVVNVDSGN